MLQFLFDLIPDRYFIKKPRKQVFYYFESGYLRYKFAKQQPHIKRKDITRTISRIDALGSAKDFSVMTNYLNTLNEAIACKHYIDPLVIVTIMRGLFKYKHNFRHLYHETLEKLNKLCIETKQKDLLKGCEQLNPYETWFHDMAKG